jgi:hypothetical protein
MNELRRFGPLLVAAWGWSMVAVGAAHSLDAVVAAGIGLVAALLQVRFVAATAAVELAALAWVVVRVGDGKLTFILIGALLAVAARAAVRALRTPEEGG